MTHGELVMVLAYCTGNFVLSAWLLHNNRQLRDEWREHKKVRTRLYQELANPDNIEAEMEKGARAREMYDAQRHALPREGAWPPAKVYRPRLRGAKPGNWRLPRA